MAAKKRAKKKPTVNFGDEDQVLEEVARALGEDPDDLKIEEDSGLTGFGEGSVYAISSGRTEYQVVENEDQEYKLAVAVVSQDLEEDPSMFEKGFIESHIDKDHLRKELHSDAVNSKTDWLSELDADDFWKEWERDGKQLPEHAEPDEDDEDWELPDPDDSEIEELAESLTTEELRDPMQYLEDIYGDEAPAKALEIAGLDIEEAAEDAVDTDGPQHFLARYDGNSHTTRSGLVYWRSN